VQLKEYKVDLRHNSVLRLLPAEHTLEKHEAMLQDTSTEELRA
jgi:hypothetical protein